MNKKIFSIIKFLYTKEQQKLKYLTVISLIFLSRLFVVVAPWILTNMIDDIKKLSDVNLVLIYLLLYFVVRFCAYGFSYVFDKKFISVGMNSVQVLINRCLEYYISNIYEKKSNGIINSELVRYRTNIFNFYSYIIKHFLPIVIELVISIVFCFFMLGWEYSVVILISTYLFFKINHYWNNKSYQYIKDRDKTLDKSNAFVEDLLRNKVKIFQNNMQSSEINNFQYYSQQYIDNYSAHARCQITSELQKNIIIISSLSLMIGMLFYGILYQNKTVGDLLLLITLTTSVFSALANAGYIFSGLMGCLPTMESMIAILGKEVVAPVKTSIKTLNKINICLKDFSLVLRKEKFNLQNISLNINHGEKVAIIGNSGSGKSTLLKTIYGLYHQKIIDSSSLSWFLEDGTFIDYDNRKNYATFINQNSTFFNKSIAYNILYGIEYDSLTDFISHHMQIIQEVLIVSGVSKIMLNRGLTLDSDMNEKNGFSGGELQKLSLANILLQVKLQNKSIIFFDEFSSAIDKITESEIINQIIFEYLKNYTVIMVSHNISSVINFDKIVVMSQGKLMASGKHATLINTSDFYKSSIYL